jgi:septum formation protein
VIGSDQVAELDGHAIGKPGSRDKAIEQLVASSGRRVVFHTAVCVASRRRDDSMMTEIAVDRTVVVFRELTEEEIVRYVDRESPLDAAGSFKSEGLGIALFECIQTSDPTALIGLPLIALAHLLRGAGFELP